ncbi:MAG TPA: 23S rRNA (uracil(1939)-C(5))-methyltransferase RlmD [Solirubrobacteraceae bacterium]|nr:23S rRNA (uracil(1939)-C(5))-methyltransferase RlmD [Solirubrobacteraceae bacterium]
MNTGPITDASSEGPAAVSDLAGAQGAGAGASPAIAPDARTARPRPGDELELEVESLAFGGEGVARLGEEGYVVFVAGAMPGDRVRATVSRRKRSYARAYATEILRPSPERIPALAQHPGVPWQVLPYERQLEVKQSQVQDALQRLGRLDGFELQEIVPAVEQWRYRNKLEYSFGTLAPADTTGAGDEMDSTARARSEGELVCGFHASGGWKEVVPFDDCLLASEIGNRAREVALRWCREQGLVARDRAERAAGPAADGRARLRNLVVREGRRSGPKLQVRVVSTDGELDAGAFALELSRELGEHLGGVLWTRSGSLAETTAGGDTELVWGEAELPERLGGLDLRISPEAFFQTNTEMAERLYEIVGEYAALAGWERVYDLYCGLGTIALSLAPRAGELWGIELVEPAVADAIAAAERNGVTNARFFAGDARTALPELVRRAGRPDVLVVDPPRAGLSKKVVQRIVEASPRRIVYVSCNPTTLAPNAAELGRAGWRLTRVRPVDMFPQTHHVECVALLERDDGRPISAAGAVSAVSG